MKVINRVSGVLALLVIISLGFASSIHASEGTFELRNRVGDSARCWAGSVLMENNRYEILLSCRDILYPGGTEVFSYVVWAVPSEGGNPIRLGSVGLGKQQFQTREAFSSIYITKEPSSNPRTPQGQIVMQGSGNRIELLDGPAPTPSSEELGTPTPTPIPTPRSTSIGRVFAAGGVLAFIAIFGVILVVLVITRK